MVKGAGEAHLVFEIAVAGGSIGVVVLFLMLAVAACSRVWRLFDLALVSSSRLGDVAAIGKGRGNASL
jgi:hypothetical protein